MNFSIHKILDKFTQKSRVLVLLILVVSMTGAFVWSAYLKSDNYSCKEIIEENFALHSDFAKMSSLVREMQMLNVQKQRLQTEAKKEDTAKSRIPASIQMPVEIGATVTESSILEVEEKLLSEMNNVLQRKNGK